MDCTSTQSPATESSRTPHIPCLELLSRARSYYTPELEAIARRAYADDYCFLERLGVSTHKELPPSVQMSADAAAAPMWIPDVVDESHPGAARLGYIRRAIAAASAGAIKSAGQRRRTATPTTALGSARRKDRSLGKAGKGQRMPPRPLGAI